MSNKYIGNNSNKMINISKNGLNEKHNKMNEVNSDNIHDMWSEILADILSNWEYTLDEDSIKLTKYIGKSPNIVVEPKYILNGKTYNTKIYTNQILNASKSISMKDIKSVVFKQGIDTSSLKWLDYMFAGCSSLTELDLSAFDISNVNNLQDLLNGCKSLRSINLSTWNTSKVTAMNQLFADCQSLQSIDVSNFDTTNVTTMLEMFAGCKSITELDLSNFNTSKLKNTMSMFAYCTNLRSLNLTSFDMHNTTNMYQMFIHCQNLTEILVSRDKWVIPEGCNVGMMFYDCGVDHVTYID